jgi:uncharacterized damage-inducible protein DinB
MNDDLRFPIGKFQWSGANTPEDRERYISALAEAPANLRAAVAGLNDQQLDTPYRPGGWTVRQVVHHLPDSHANMYVRLKLALTEDEPLIKPYDEAAWAELPENKATPIEVSLNLLDALHTRTVNTLRGATPEQFARTFRHPERGVMSLDQVIGLYAWHGAHHVAHITRLRDRNGW